jgi:hypothetical protein
MVDDPQWSMGVWCGVSVYFTFALNKTVSAWKFHLPIMG